jgi:hypothetical protein
MTVPFPPGRVTDLKLVECGNPEIQEATVLGGWRAAADDACDAILEAS